MPGPGHQDHDRDDEQHELAPHIGDGGGRHEPQDARSEARDARDPRQRGVGADQQRSGQEAHAALPTATRGVTPPSRHGSGGS